MSPNLPLMSPWSFGTFLWYSRFLKWSRNFSVQRGVRLGSTHRFCYPSTFSSFAYFQQNILIFTLMYILSTVLHSSFTDVCTSITYMIAKQTSKYHCIFWTPVFQSYHETSVDHSTKCTRRICTPYKFRANDQLCCKCSHETKYYSSRKYFSGILCEAAYVEVNDKSGLPIDFYNAQILNVYRYLAQSVCLFACRLNCPSAYKRWHFVS